MVIVNYLLQVLLLAVGTKVKSYTVFTLSGSEHDSHNGTTYVVLSSELTILTCVPMTGLFRQSFIEQNKGTSILSK
jgi:hypothetical protein